MRTTTLILGLTALIAATTLLTWTVRPCATAQQPAVRSLSRNAEVAGPVTLDQEAVVPLFPDGAPASVARWLAAGEASRCRTDLEEWVQTHPDHPHLAEARFVLGYCAHESGSHERALQVLSASVTDVPLLSGLAAFLAADSAYELDAYQAAIALTLSVPNDSVYGPRSRFLRGRAMRRAGRLLEAVGVLRDFVGAYPDAYYIAAVELELARALAEIGEHEQAAELFHRVSVRYPGSSEETAASSALESLLPQLPEPARERFAGMDDDDLLARATALFDRHRSEQVIDLLEDQLDRLSVDTPLGCRAAFLVGKSYTKLRRHSEAVPFYEAIADAGCEEDLVVRALYRQGQALWNVDRDQESIAAFRRLYAEHADHSYADDAMLYEARIERSNGRTERYLAILEEQTRRFSDGDMLGDANWLLFENEFSSGRYEAAVAFADAIAARTGENTLYNRGRIPYFRGRALELFGRVDEAMQAYEAVATGVPLSYYALLALNRLRQLDTERCERLVEQLRSGWDASASEGIPVEPTQLLEDAAFQGGVLLLRLGLLQPARRQFDRLLETYPNQDGTLWLVTFLFDRAGAYHISHDIPRRRIDSFLAAYPTAETAERWRLAYPTPFLEEVSGAAQARGLDRELIYAIMREESGFNPHAESWANARGLMQLMLPTAESMASRLGIRRLRSRDLFDPSTAIELGSEYLSVLAARYDRHPVLTIAGYNGGEGNVDRWLRNNGQLPIDRFVEEIPYRQTRDYTKRVLMTYWIYAWLGGERPLPPIPFDLPSPP